MMACNCLNVIIESETNDFPKVNLDSLSLTETERKDNFFNQDLLQVQKLLKITKNISGLVTSRIVGSWIVHHCINCNIHTHAIHRDRGAALVLISSKLLTGSKISTLRNSEQYSNIFNLIVNDYDPLEDEKRYDYLPAEVELNINSLRQKVNEVINRESAATEERIRKYTEQQHLALEEFRDKVLKEHRALRRVILDHKLGSSRSNETSTNVEMTSPVNIKSPVKNVPEDFINSKPITVLGKTKQQNLSNASPKAKLMNHTRLSYNSNQNHKNSFDTEGLFQLDEMEDLNSYVHSDQEDSENEDSMRDDGAEHIQRQKNYASNLAKSLPMDIPVFMSAFQNHVNEDSEDTLAHPEDPMDIAASIKALAKSVHGDTVFGDLPRPRFSTQI